MLNGHPNRTEYDRGTGSTGDRRPASILIAILIVCVVGTVVSKCRPGTGYKVQALYLRFTNTSVRGDTVSIRGLDTVVITNSIVRGRISDYILIASRRYD